MTDFSKDVGSVITVDGRISPEELGTTITHEHVFVDFAEPWFVEPDSAYERRLANEPVSMENLWYIRSKGMRHKDNLRLESMELAIEEFEKYRRAGGDTVVDVTPKGIGGDPESVRGVGRSTGVQFIQGTAYYIRDVHPERVDNASLEELEEEFVSDVREGIDDTTVRAGIIGEIGLSGHIHEQEEKVLRAGARAAARTGAPLSIHPPGRTPDSQQNRTYPTSRWCLEVLDIVEETGLPTERVIMDHMDRTLYENLEYQFELAERGPYLEYDLWGTHIYLEHFQDAYPPDTWRVEAVAELVAEGYTDQLLFSHDNGGKSAMTKFGGVGYAHIPDTVVSMLLNLTEEVKQNDIEQILIDNPKDILAFVEPM